MFIVDRLHSVVVVAGTLLPLALVAGEESGVLLEGVLLEGVLLEGVLVVDLVWRRWGVVSLSSTWHFLL